MIESKMVESWYVVEEVVSEYSNSRIYRGDGFVRWKFGLAYFSLSFLELYILLLFSTINTFL